MEAEIKTTPELESTAKENPGDHAIQLQIPPLQEDISPPKRRWRSTVFEPRSEMTYPTPKPVGRKIDGKNLHHLAPEKKLIHFALRLAVVEKTATGLGKIAFIWATVVLLGGFASSLKTMDFWFVTAILLVEGFRIFSRSHELRWQHYATKTATVGQSIRKLVSSSRNSFKNMEVRIQPLLCAKSESKIHRRLSRNVKLAHQHDNHDAVDNKPRQSSDGPLLPLGRVFLPKNISRMLVWLQLLSAAACASLSLMQLSQQKYGDAKAQEMKNRKAALNLFYALSLSEALMFILEKAYWELNYGKLLLHVCKKYDLGDEGIIPVKRFFYDAYSSCVNGSIFDGVKMDLVTFAGELLDSDSNDEQLIGARVLIKFVMNNRFANDTLRKIGTSTAVIERLIEMLNWKNQGEKWIRKSAAQIISKLAGKKQNALRVAGILGAMESISSLLHTGRSSEGTPHEISTRSIVTDQMDYEYSEFNLLGLLILRNLARDHVNCGKIGNSRGLLAKIIDLTSASESLLTNQAPESQVKTVRRSLKLVKMLVSTTGNTGKMLRKEISEIIFTVSNIRDILQYGEGRKPLQKLAIEILTSLAMDSDAKEKIGSSGSIIKLLLTIFFKPGAITEQDSVSIVAGEALSMLALDSKNNCRRILKNSQVVQQLVGALKEPVTQVNSSRILQNLCAYSGTEYFSLLEGVTSALPTVLTTIMVEKDKLLEVSIGLAMHIFKVTSPEAYDKELAKAGITDLEFAERMVQILKLYKYPEIKVPRIRFFVIELAVHMMKSQMGYVHLLRKLGMDEVLDHIAETTSELENFTVFSGSVGITRHKTSMSSLVEIAQELIQKE